MIEVLAGQFNSLGGLVLGVLVLMSIAATAIALFKIFQFAYLGVGRYGQVRDVVERWRSGRRDDALQAAAKSRNPMVRVAYGTMYGVVHGKAAERDAMREFGIHAASQQLTYISRHVRLLEAVVQAAPMLGLLGTVLGMIEAFATMSAEGGAVDPAALAGGIWTALTTTAVGLTIAIPFYFVSLWLEERIDRERTEMEAVIFAIIHSGD